MNESDLLLLADLNRTEYWCQSLNWIPGTEVFKNEEAVFINSAVDFAGCNVVLTQSAGTPEVISRSQEFFKGRRRYFALLLRKHTDEEAIQFCVRSKMLQISNNPGMALDQPVSKAGLPEGAELRWVTDEAGLRDFQQITAEAYQDLGLPAEITAKYFALPERVLSPHSIWAVVYYRGEPASAAMAILSHGIAGIYWVGSARKARGLGLAAYCTQEVGNASFDLGARKVILQASQFGEPVYRKLGYREITRYPWFICSGQPSS